jgi:hypothetical protein
MVVVMVERNTILCVWKNLKTCTVEIGMTDGLCGGKLGGVGWLVLVVALYMFFNFIKKIVNFLGGD